MPSVIHFRKQLSCPPVEARLANIGVRSMIVPDDIASWLVLRGRAMADEMPRVRVWSKEDFRVEMTDKSWWTSGCMWVATTDDSVVGAVTLALRAGATGTVPVVHWLLVDPAFRRLGVGRLLMSCLERAAWDAGWREVQLETHSGWTAAVAFYHSIGYAPLRDRSLR
jgi:GNAT superfamily N-acetyltransferase